MIDKERIAKEEMIYKQQLIASWGKTLDELQPKYDTGKPKKDEVE